MKYVWLCCLMLLLLVGCMPAKGNESLALTDPPVDEIQCPKSNEIAAEPAAYYQLSTEQSLHIREMISTSGVYAEYNPKTDLFGLDILQNRIGIVKQSKDFPTLEIARFEDPETKYMVYVIRRFYREDIEFTYVKDGVTKKATLEVSLWINQSRNTWTHWSEYRMDGYLYVPGSSGQLNYPLYYDILNQHLYVEDDTGKRDVIEFTEDLQEKVVIYMQEQYRKFTRIDQEAVKLAKDIIEYIDPYPYQ